MSAIVTFGWDCVQVRTSSVGDETVTGMLGWQSLECLVLPSLWWASFISTDCLSAMIEKVFINHCHKLSVCVCVCVCICVCDSDLWLGL